MTNEQPKVQYTLEAITKQLELLQQNPNLLANKYAPEKNTLNTDNAQHAEENSKIISFPKGVTDKLRSNIKVTSTKKDSKTNVIKEEKTPKVKSEKAHLVTVPKLLINNIKIGINTKRIVLRIALKNVPKATSALAFLVTLPIGVVNLAKNAIQYKYGDWYYNKHLEKKAESERQENMALAEELEHQQRIDDMIAALDAQDKEIIQEQREDLEILKEQRKDILRSR